MRVIAILSTLIARVHKFKPGFNEKSALRQIGVIDFVISWQMCGEGRGLRGRLLGESGRGAHKRPTEYKPNPLI